MEEKTFLCDNCGHRHPIHLKTVFRDQQLCPGCLDQTTLICSRCGERIWAEDNSGTAGLFRFWVFPDCTFLDISSPILGKRDAFLK